MKYLIILTLPFVLTACPSSGAGNVAPPEGRSIHVDERLLIECKKPKELIDNPRPSDVVKQHGDDMKLFSDCVNQQRALIDAVRKIVDK